MTNTEIPAKRLSTSDNKASKQEKIIDGTAPDAINDDHDSGGPAVRDGILLGIVSFGGRKCGDPQSPGVYSRVSEITSWVESTITANEASTVPELVPKILKARQREKELQNLIILLLNKEIDGDIFNDKPILRNKEVGHGNVDKKEVDSREEIKALLEARYKFSNDETSTRYRITRDDRDSAGISESHDEKQLALVFRSYAARRIVGGMETSISMYPYNVAISRNGNHWCGGSVIDEQWIFTAGHCLESAHDGDQKKLINYIVRAGSSFHNRGGYQARINKAFFPSNYVPGNADFDFSLARLDRPMPIGRNIAVLNLPSRDYQIKTDDILIVTGWGSTDQSGYGNIPDRLRFVPVPVMAADECQHAYRFYITPRMVCAGYATGGKDACNSALIAEFKAQVEDKKNKIKNWLRETLSSPTFLELAKRKLKEAGFNLRRRYRRNYDDDINDDSFLDDSLMDDINLTNQINERILGDGEENEAEALLRMMALQEIMDENKDNDFGYRNSSRKTRARDLIAYVT
ncbi:Trypsin-4 [Papilio machaon]|uniref:Trypsin-4 n=1 Tax=Papilio machaon TaxID=76193 RepID=A0A0N1IGV8_PAPMA|nr:Trypsin-4 [Papilio machaon]